MHRTRGNDKAKPDKKAGKADAKKGNIKRDALSEEQLAEMLEVVSKRHRMLKKKLKTTKNPKARDKATIQYMLKQSIEMLELANTTFVTSGGRGIYSLIALNSNIREMQNDLRSLEDNSEQINFLIGQVIKPMLTIISQQNISMVMLLKNEINKRVKSDKAAIIIDKLNDLLKASANLYDDCLNQAETKITSYFDE